MTDLPDHLAGAPTWSSALAWWRGRDDPAVVTGTTTWSGAELMARSAGAAAHLRAVTERDGPVPALLSSTPAAVAYVVAGADCGRPLAPLGPRLTTNELGPCIDGLGSDILLTELAFLPLAEQLARRRAQRVVVVGDPPPAYRPLALDPDPEAIAFVLHTSGTTGVPKAVPYRQARLAERTRVNTGLCGLGPGCVYATASPLHHIAGLGNHAVALAAGATLAPVPRFTVDAWTALAGLHVTHALTVPTTLEILLDAHALALPDLRTLQYGGSPIHPATLQRTLAAIPGAELVNIFGQTEGSPITCLTPDDHRRIAAGTRADLLESVGRPAPGTELRIDGADQAGVGEVVARGDHLFLLDDEGWLRTGDLGRLDDEGYLFLVGRRGDRIIRGGENVYPVEIEQALEQHPGVREAAVVGVADRRWGEVVRAVIVPADPARPPDPDELRAHTRALVAGFKVPAQWAFVDTLPRNAGGKLLRRLLKSVR
jgi:acyl-CoA synthetase (AMP-forming)/AMP-acid ligase II